MRTAGTGRTGAVLATVVVLGGVLAILATAVFVVFQTNASSYRYRLGRVRAQLAAEAGVSLALHTLEMETEAPAGPPFSLPGDSAQWISLPSGDQVWVVVDPSDQNGLPLRVGSVEIRSRGFSEDCWRDVVVRAAPDYPSRYALLTDEGIPAGILADCVRFDGPVHSNGRIHLSSNSPDSTEDVWVASISTAPGGGFVFSDAGPASVPHPEGSRVWVRPYPRTRQGPPWWDPSADSISFDRLSEYMAGLYDQASAQGTVLWGARRVILDGQRLLALSGEFAVPDTLWLDGRTIVYLAGYTPVLLKSRTPLTLPLTIVSTGPLGFMGPVQAGTAYSGTPLGLVTLSNVFVARDPDLFGMPDWQPPWDIVTDNHVTVMGSICAPRGTLSAEDPTGGGNRYSFNVRGGLTVGRLGVLGSGSSGYGLAVGWDEGLASYHPPLFPSLENWKMFSWMIDPDYGDRDIDDNQY